MKLKTRDTAPDLSPEVVSILLAGWSAPMPPEPSKPGFGSGLLELFDGHAAQIWRANETWLRLKAQAWGWTPSVVGPDGHCRFWAEHVAAGFRE